MSAWGGGGQAAAARPFRNELDRSAVIDAFCRAERNTNLRSPSLRKNWFDIDVGVLHRELSGAAPSHFSRPSLAKPRQPAHGRAYDPLTDVDIPSAERVDDGLPQSLEACVKAYGLTHFKISSGRRRPRPRPPPRVWPCCHRTPTRPGSGLYAFTLDGNENFKSISPSDAVGLTYERAVAQTFMTRLLFVRAAAAPRRGPGR